MAGSINFDDVTSEVITECRTLKRGDQLAVEGNMYGFGYYHHGIFLGHDKGVAHFQRAGKADFTVQVVDILEFTEMFKRTLVRINYPKGQCLDPETVAKNAENLVANPSKCGKYCVVDNNCEHLATWCKTRVLYSKQVKDKPLLAFLKPLVKGSSAAGSFSSSSGSFGSSAGSFGSSAGSFGSSTGSFGSRRAEYKKSD